MMSDVFSSVIFTMAYTNYQVLLRVIMYTLVQLSTPGCRQGALALRFPSPGRRVSSCCGDTKPWRTEENRRITAMAVIPKSTNFTLQNGLGAFHVSLYLINYMFIELGNSKTSV